MHATASIRGHRRTYEPRPVFDARTVAVQSGIDFQMHARGIRSTGRGDGLELPDGRDAEIDVCLGGCTEIGVGSVHPGENRGGHACAPEREGGRYVEHGQRRCACLERSETQLGCEPLLESITASAVPVAIRPKPGSPLISKV